MSKVKVAVIGNGTLASSGLEALVSCVDVQLVIADVRDSGEDTWRRSLVKAARALGFEAGKTLLQPRNPNDDDTIQRIKNVSPDILLSLQCRHIIREPLFRTSRLATLNLHNAPLPLLRGCDPFGWAIHDGLKYMGVTLHRILDEGVDNGPILMQRLWPIHEDSTAWDLYQEGLIQAVELLKGGFNHAQKMNWAGIPQEERFVTYHPMGQFNFSNMEVDWTVVAETLSAWIRARIFPPFHFPFFYAGKQKVEILRCRKIAGNFSPGSIVGLNPIVVSAKWGGIEIMELRVDGQIVDSEKASRMLGLQIGQAVI